MYAETSLPLDADTLAPLRWEAPPAEPRLGPAEVHVWRAELDRPPAELQALRTILAPQETERATRFVFDRDRDRFVCARGILRSILSRYLGVPPSALVLAYGPNGKPHLPAESGADGLRFNVSHSGALAVFALARGIEVGIDIERVDRQVEGGAIASSYFAPSEASAIEELQGDARAHAFFDIWTRKEALLKAWGEGMATDLRGFEAPLGRDGMVPSPVPGGRACHLRGLAPAPGYAGALAVEGDAVAEVRCFQFHVAACEALQGRP